jgi:ferric-dicitrate binding protein FerR (iron transport regulator)
MGIIKIKKEMNPNSDIHVLSANYLAGEMNSRQERKFLKMLASHPDQKATFEKLKTDWDYMLTRHDNSQPDTHAAWNSLYTKLDADGLLVNPAIPVQRIPMYTWRLAASILLILAISIPAVLYFQGRSGITADTSFAAEEQTMSYDLPDGSRVFLKKGSEISFSARFENDRKLSLQGEAYFDVMADPAHPFRITTGEAVISVLGTEFNVKENEAAGHTEVLVESGNVLVRGRGNSQEINLTPGEFAISTRKQVSLEKQADTNYLAWKTRIFEFRNKPLQEVFALLEDVYQVKILVEDEKINDLRLTSSYHKQSAEAVLNTIGAAFGLNIVHDSENYEVNFNP